MLAQWHTLRRARLHVEEKAQQEWQRRCRERDLVVQAIVRIEERRRAIALQGASTLAVLGHGLGTARDAGAAIDRTSQAGAVPYLARLRRQDQQLYLQLLQAQLRLAAEQHKVDQALRHRRQAEAGRMRVDEAIATFERMALRRAARREEADIDEFTAARGA